MSVGVGLGTRVAGKPHYPARMDKLVLRARAQGDYDSWLDSIALYTAPYTVPRAPVVPMHDQLTVGVDSLLGSGKTLAINGQQFSSSTPGGPYVRDPDLWAAGIDISCVSVYYSMHVPNERRLTMITPRHGVVVKHAGDYIIGQTYGFLGMDDTYHERTIQQVVLLDNDMAMILLSSDLPAAIKPCKVTPSNWGDAISLDQATNMANNIRIPVLVVNKYDEVNVNDFRYARTTPFHEAVYVAPTDPDRLAIYRAISGSGDSGCPAFFIHNGEPVLISIWTLPASGTAYAGYISLLDAQILVLDAAAGISTGYTVTEDIFTPDTITDFPADLYYTADDVTFTQDDYAALLARVSGALIAGASFWFKWQNRFGTCHLVEIFAYEVGYVLTAEEIETNKKYLCTTGCGAGTV